MFLIIRLRRRKALLHDFFTDDMDGDSWDSDGEEAAAEPTSSAATSESEDKQLEEDRPDQPSAMPTNYCSHHSADHWHY